MGRSALNTKQRKRAASTDAGTKTTKKSRTDKAASAEKTSVRSGESAASSQEPPGALEPRCNGRKMTCRTEEEEIEETAAQKAAGVIVIDETSSSGAEDEVGSKGSSREPSPEEDSEAELGESTQFMIANLPLTCSLLERLADGWTSPIYAFYLPLPSIEYIDGRRCHAFHCAAKGCKQRIRRYLDKGDVSSTSNMRRHAKACWGAPAVTQADEMGDVTRARLSLAGEGLRDGDITIAFARQKGKVTYRHRAHTKAETR